MVLGPIIGTTFSTVNSSLSHLGGGTSTTTTTTVTGCPSVHADGYATGAGYGWDCYSPTYGHYNLP